MWPSAPAANPVDARYAHDHHSSGLDRRQFVRDYATQFEELKALTADWQMEDFAERCGIDPQS